MAKKLTKSKAKEILHDKSVHGHPLTDKQRRFFGAIAGGAKPYKAQIGTMLTGFHPNLAENLSEVLSAPQKAATQLVTGKYQTPSEAMGIQNAAGAFLTDVVLDPLGLMGLGSAKRLGVLGKLDPRFKSKPGAYYRKIGDVEGVEDLRTSGVVRSKPLDPKVLEEYKRRNITHYPDPYFSVGKPIENYKGKYMLEYTGGTPFDTWDILGHEVGTPKGKIKIEDPGLKLYKKDWLRGYKEVKKTPKKKQDGGWLDKYVPKAQNGIEGTMGGLTDKGFNYNGAWGGPSMQMGGNIMPAMAGANQTVPMAQLGDSVKPIPMQLAMGGSLPGAVGFTYARTAGAAPANGPYAKKTKASAQNGQEMKFYQAGLDFKPKTISQDGSEIPVDSMGYWNPDNWGNPVIIPSTDITMEGVDVPLIGISDTGDVQYMEPGEDYEFDGEYVTEYPVAKKGISVNSADAQPIKKLDQLLNFTNYNKPTKGGWLDKYN